MRNCLRCCLLASLIVGCQVLQSQSKQADAERTFADLSLAEKYTYLRAVLKAQTQVLRDTRIARVKSYEEYLTHKVDLQAQLLDNGVGRPKLLRVSWSPVQADSIELLRCTAENITTAKTVAADENEVAAGYNFDTLQSNPHAYGFLACTRVYGTVKNGTSVIDHGAENNFSYVYFFRPCFKNYTLAAPATSSTTDKQCGAEKIKAAEGQQATLTQANKLTLVYRYCQTDARQVCSTKVTRSNGNAPAIALNNGVQKLPTHLFKERDELVKEIEKYKQIIWDLGLAVSEELVGLTREDFKDDPKYEELAAIARSQDELQARKEAHDLDNEQRIERAESVAAYTDILNQSLANNLGTEMSFGSRNCYGEYKDVQETMTIDSDALKEQFAAEGLDLSDEELAELDFSEDKEMQQMKSIMSGVAVADCLVSTAGELGKLHHLNPLKPKKLGNFTEMGKKLNKGERGLAYANIAVALLPMQNSELNKGDSIDAFTDALNGIFMGADTYTKSHCQACLDHLAKVRYYARKTHFLKQELVTLEETIQEELLKKGAVNPDEKE